MTSTSDEDPVPATDLPEGWVAKRPGPDDAVELAALLRRQQEHGRGWPSATPEQVLTEVSEIGYRTRRHVVLRDAERRIRAWASAHDRAAGRLVLAVVVDPLLADGQADVVAGALLAWGERAALVTGRRRGLPVQQIDSGSFAGDQRQERWLTGAGFVHVRTWWQMSRPVTPAEAAIDPAIRSGVRIRPVRRVSDGMPDEDDLRTVHDILESAFADHFNSHEETFDEFVSRLREDPGHRWDHWWVAELVDDAAPVPAGALVASVSEGAGEAPDGSYVEYVGVLQTARGRGLAQSLLLTAIRDAAARGRNRVDLEVDADSPTGAAHLYTRMGWTSRYVTGSWHKNVPIGRAEAEPGS